MECILKYKILADKVDNAIILFYQKTQNQYDIILNFSSCRQIKPTKRSVYVYMILVTG